MRRSLPEEIRNACTSNDAAAIRRMIADGIDVNAQGLMAETALHWAVKFSSIDVIKELLAAGADLSIPDNDGKTPLNLAEESQYRGMVDIVKEAAQ